MTALARLGGMNKRRHYLRGKSVISDLRETWERQWNRSMRDFFFQNLPQLTPVDWATWLSDRIVIFSALLGSLYRIHNTHAKFLFNRSVWQVHCRSRKPQWQFRTPRKAKAYHGIVDNDWEHVLKSVAFDSLFCRFSKYENVVRWCTMTITQQGITNRSSLLTYWILISTWATVSPFFTFWSSSV